MASGEASAVGRAVTGRAAARRAVAGAAARPRFAVVGAGHGGLALAGVLGMMGFPVRLLNRSPGRVAPVAELGGIEIEGQLQGFGEVDAATTSAAEALSGAEIVMVVVPASAHRDVARQLAPHLTPAQVVVLNPGRTGGTLEFLATLRDAGWRGKTTVAEAQTFLFASRAVGPARARIVGIKRAVPVAAVPARRTAEVVSKLNGAFPQFVAAQSLWETSLHNLGAVFHPPLTVLNAARIESTGGDFDYYHQGITPAVSAVLEAVDSERVEVARALGVNVPTAREWLFSAYGAGGASLYEAVLNNEGYRGIRAPADLSHRYIFEDVPCSLVPIASLGDMLGVPTPTVKNIVHLASLLHGVDYWACGRTVERLGLAGRTVPEIHALVAEGELP